jgi:hypothetical protein
VCSVADALFGASRLALIALAVPLGLYLFFRVLLRAGQGGFLNLIFDFAGLDSTHKKLVGVWLLLLLLAALSTWGLATYSQGRC